MANWHHYEACPDGRTPCLLAFSKLSQEDGHPVVLHGFRSSCRSPAPEFGLNIDLLVVLLDLSERSAQFPCAANPGRRLGT